MTDSTSRRHRRGGVREQEARRGLELPGTAGGLPDVAVWAETEIPLAADLLSGKDEPALVGDGAARARRWRRCPRRCGARARPRPGVQDQAPGRCRVFRAGSWPCAAAAEGLEFAIGAKRIASMWRALAGIAEDAWRDAARHARRAGRGVAVQAGPVARRARCCWSAG